MDKNDFKKGILYTVAFISVTLAIGTNVDNVNYDISDLLINEDYNVYSQFQNEPIPYDYLKDHYGVIRVRFEDGTEESFIVRSVVEKDPVKIWYYKLNGELLDFSTSAIMIGREQKLDEAIGSPIRIKMESLTDYIEENTYYTREDLVYLEWKINHEEEKLVRTIG